MQSLKRDSGSPKQQTLTQTVKVEFEPEQPQPLQEAEYHGTCYGKPCFQVTDDSTVGCCVKSGVYVSVELAKRQMLCDIDLDEKRKGKQ
jgi:hypothetical protein